MDLNNPEVRQQELAARLHRKEQLVVSEVAAEFDISVDTVRRDIIALEEAGLARRVRGGAVPLGPLPDRLTERLQLKDRFPPALIDAALAQVEGCSTVILDGGATALAVAGRLPRLAGRRVITASPYVAVACQKNALDVFMLGGRLSPYGGVNVGEVAENRLAGIYADVVVLGACAVDSYHGLSSDDFEESQLSEAMAAAAAKVVVVTEASKLGRRALHHTLPPNKIDVLVTKTDPVQAEEFRSAGFEVLNV